MTPRLPDAASFELLYVVIRFKSACTHNICTVMCNCDVHETLHYDVDIKLQTRK
jgi:hypothetical protein